MNLVEGDEAVVEKPQGTFEPFVVHYAETFIIPANVGTYIVRPLDAKNPIPQRAPGIAPTDKEIDRDDGDIYPGEVSMRNRHC